jgi:hypothetical protein
MPYESWRYTDNPNDPCAYCCQWKNVGDEFDPVYVPIMPSGPITRVWSGTHQKCQASIDAYMAESKGL